MENNINAITPFFSWEDVNPTLIPNTTMQKRLRDGVGTLYKIVPIEGYVLHDKGRDCPIEDPDTYEQIGTRRGYTKMGTTCAINYNFDTVNIFDEDGVSHVSYGNRELFSRPMSQVSGEQIF